MNHKTILLAVIIGLVLIAWPARVGAQSPVAPGWTEPHRLSNADSSASEAAVVADEYGFVHVFWSETLDDGRSKLQYARYDGNTWNSPVDIRYFDALLGPKSLSPFVDERGTLHLAWVSGQNGPAIYSKAPANNATETPNWMEGRVIRVPANAISLAVDEAGSLHVLYQAVTEFPSRPGVYYVRSSDEGWTWTDPVWLDPDIPPGMVPRTVQMELDDADNLHAMWFYVSTAGSEGDWIRYARSTDGGESWSEPLTLAKNSAGDAQLNPNAGPILKVNGQAVHVVWGAGDLLYRHHRYSLDGGSSWSPAKRIFGDLNGQAFDGFAVDGAGRLHFVGQIRFPTAIYHSVWDDGVWSRPEPIYTIRLGSEDPIPEGVVQAHHTHPAFRNGTELVVTFADPPPEFHRQLYVFSHTLTDTPAPPLRSTPTLAPTATPVEPTLTPTPLPTATPMVFGEDVNGGLLASLASSPQLSVGIGAVIVVFLVGLSQVVRYLLRLQRS